VYPEAYKFEPRKTSPSGKSPAMSSEEHLTLVRVPHDLARFHNSNTFAYSSHINSSGERSRRKDQFRNRLIARIRRRYDEFLRDTKLSAGGSGSPIGGSARRLTAWHKNFDLETVPDIEESVLFSTNMLSPAAKLPTSTARRADNTAQRALFPKQDKDAKGDTGDDTSISSPNNKEADAHQQVMLRHLARVLSALWVIYSHDGKDKIPLSLIVDRLKVQFGDRWTRGEFVLLGCFIWT